MAKLDAKYEAMVVFSVKTNDEEQIKALTNKFSELIKNNGTLEGVDEWGKRKLAYDINYESEATMFSTISRASPISPRSLSVSSALPMAFFAQWLFLESNRTKKAEVLLWHLTEQY